jgi:hypothetical protein
MLSVMYDTDTEFCEGDECSSACRTERSVLRSKNDTTLVISIEAKFNNLIVLNAKPYTQPDSSLLFVQVNLVNQLLTTAPIGSQAWYNTSTCQNDTLVNTGFTVYIRCKTDGKVSWNSSCVGIPE